MYFRNHFIWSIEAHFNLGAYYDLYEDYANTAVWYAAAAYQGSADAQCNLGVLYKEGNGVEQSAEKAFELFSKAAEQGSAEAEYWLGNAYLNGYGTEQNVLKGTEWLKKAADQGVAGAKQLLADYLL